MLNFNYIVVIDLNKCAIWRKFTKKNIFVFDHKQWFWAAHAWIDLDYNSLAGNIHASICGAVFGPLIQSQFLTFFESKHRQMGTILDSS